MEVSTKIMNNLRNTLYSVNNVYYSINGKYKEAIIMPVGLNYQLSILGNYSVSLSPEMITTLMTKINQVSTEVFLPNIINSQQIEIPSNRVSTISNLGFVTQDQKYNIAILNDRIDINYNKALDIELGLGEFYAMAESLLKSIMQTCSFSSNRLAANMRMLLELESFDYMQGLGKKILKSPQYYGDKSFCEWSTRVNAQSSIQIRDMDEGINVITDISSAQSAQGEKAAVIYHMDINTLPQNTNMRFDCSSLKPFIDCILPIAGIITNDVERLIFDD